LWPLSDAFTEMVEAEEEKLKARQAKQNQEKQAHKA
jgi:hypothetical protein